MNEAKIRKPCFCCKKGAFVPVPPGTYDTYQCNNCEHIYRMYFKSAAKFHSDDGDYRKNEYDEVTKTFDGWVLKNSEMRLERVRNQISHFKKYVNDKQTCLEVASGKGFMLKELEGVFKHITCSDIHPSVINHNKEYNSYVDDFIVSDVLTLPDDKQYDVVIAMDMLEHVEDAHEFVDKMHSIVREYVIVQVPINRGMKPVNPNFDGHVHYFSKLSLRHLFYPKFEQKYIYHSEKGELAGGEELIAVFKKVKI